MIDFVFNVEKIGRKWITLKVQNRKDNTKFYTGYALKENVAELVKDIKVGDTIHAFASSQKEVSPYSTRYEFELKFLACDNEKANRELANLLSKRVQTLDNIRSAKNEIHSAGVHEYDEMLEKMQAEAEAERQARREELAHDIWETLVNCYKANDLDYNYQYALKRLHSLGDNSHDEEFAEMWKQIQALELKASIEKQKAERAQEKADGISDRADEHRWSIGSILVDEGKAYKVLSCKYRAHDGLSFGVMSESWYSLKVQDISGTEEGKSKIEKEEREKKEKEEKRKIERQKSDLLTALKKACTEDITGTHSISDFEEGGVTIFNDFNVYGGGEELVAKDGILYLIINNGHDGAYWGRNNIATGGAGAYGKKSELVQELIDKINEYLKLCNREEKVENVENEEVETDLYYPNLEMYKTLDEATDIIKGTLSDIKNSYIQIGCILSQVSKEKIYKQKYKTFAEYCDIELNMKKTQAYNCIKVFEMYGNDQELNGYSFSQLILLAKNNKPVEEIIKDYPSSLSKRELEEKLKLENVHLGGQNKSKKKTFSFSEDETRLVLKALELLKAQKGTADIESLLEKLGGK